MSSFNHVLASRQTPRHRRLRFLLHSDTLSHHTPPPLALPPHTVPSHAITPHAVAPPIPESPEGTMSQNLRLSFYYIKQPMVFT